MIKNKFAQIAISLIVFTGIFNSSIAYAEWIQAIPTEIPPAKTAAISKDDCEKAAKTFREEMTRLVNAERENHGLEPVKSVSFLNDIADVRATEAAISFSHTRPNQEPCFTIYSQFSLAYYAVGENLAYGYSDPAELIKAFMNSQPHRANLLNQKFDYLGIGYYIHTDGTIYCSQLFFTPQEGDTCFAAEVPM